MIKKLTLLLLMAVLLPLLPGTPPVKAAPELAVTESTVTASFPSAITFSMSAESSAAIADVRLHYYVERLSNARVTAEIYLDITPAAEITAEWTWDMRKTGGLPPGTAVRYWWTVKDTAGRDIRTETATLVFNDDRFQWQSVQQDTVTLYWYKGSNAFAGALLDAAVEGIETLYDTTGILFTDPVAIYLYSDSNALQNAMIFPQEWTGGVAYAQYATIAIGIQEGNLDWGLRTVVHELTHLVIHRMTDNPYLELPTWLDEGLAMYMEGPLTGSFNYYLNRAVANEALLTVRSLVSPFSADATVSYLSYGESYCIVEMLIQRYDREKILDLLEKIRAGTDYDEALKQVYGFDMDELNSLFMTYMEETGERLSRTETEPDTLRVCEGILVPACAGGMS